MYLLLLSPVSPLNGALLAEFISLTDADLTEFRSATPDASVDIGAQGSAESPERVAETRKIWGSVTDELLDQLPDQDRTPIGEWMPEGVDLTWTGRDLNTIAISRHFLEAHLNNLIQAKADLVAHYRRSLQIRQDAERAFYAVRRFRDVEKDRSQLIAIFNGMEGTGSS